MSSHIEIKVDEETFLNWAAAFANLTRSFRVVVTQAEPDGSLSSRSQSIEFTGLDLLLEVGLACSRPDVLDDPARLFGLFKYALCISETPDLRLCDDVRNGDRHKRAVLSDEFGCGLSFLVARQLLAAKNFLDFQTAIDRNWVKTRGPMSRMPDYIALRNRSDKNLIVLEAKGTQSSLSYARQQIKSGYEQVKACKPVKDLKVAHRAVVGALLRFEKQKSGSVVHLAASADLGLALPDDHSAKSLILPPEPSSQVLASLGPTVNGGYAAVKPSGSAGKGSQVSKKHKTASATKTSRREIDFDFSRDIEEAVQCSHYLRASCLTGDTEVSTAMTEGQTRSRRRRPLDTQDGPAGRIEGSTLTVKSEADAATFKLHVGLVSEVRQLLLSSAQEKDVDDAAAAVHERVVIQRAERRRETRAKEQEVISEDLRSPTVSDSEDGVVLQLEFDGKASQKAADELARQRT